MGAGTGCNKTPPNEILPRYIHPYRERPGFHGDGIAGVTSHKSLSLVRALSPRSNLVSLERGRTQSGRRDKTTPKEKPSTFNLDAVA